MFYKFKTSEIKNLFKKEFQRTCILNPRVSQLQTEPIQNTITAKPVGNGLLIFEHPAAPWDVLILMNEIAAGGMGGGREIV